MRALLSIAVLLVAVTLAVLGLAGVSDVLHMNDVGDPTWLTTLRGLAMILAVLLAIGLLTVVAMLCEVVGGFSPGQLYDREHDR